MSDWSLRRRLQQHVLVLVTACWLAGSAVALVGLWHETAEVLDSALIATAHRLLALPEGTTSADVRHAAATAHVEPEADIAYQLFDRAGRLQAHSPSAPAQAMDPGAPDGLRVADGRWVLTLTRGDGLRSAQVAETLAHRHEVLWFSLGWLVLSLVALLPLLAWGLGVVIAHAFAPLEPARRALEQREPQMLHALSAQGLPNELRRGLQRSTS